jgi:hypothetical protein
VILDVMGLAASNGGPFADAPGLFNKGLGFVPVTTLFQENFSGGLSAWTIVDGGTGTGAARTWTTNNPGSRSLPLTAPFAICDSDFLGSAYTMDEQLISPVIDASLFSSVSLRFNHDFDWYGGGYNEQADVDVRSSATGGAWVNVVNYSGASATGSVSLDISAQAANQSNVQIRFHYYNANFEWWWAVDDVEVFGDTPSQCADDFTSYGNGCMGSGGFLPVLDGQGSASPGGAATLAVTGGQPGSSGYLVLATAPGAGGGCLQLSGSMWTVPLGLDGSGEALLPIDMPASLIPGVHLYLQWIGLDSGGPPKSFSNGLDVLVP